MVSRFPGGVGVSGLEVYDWPTADGLCGGSPHVHLACAEAYVVVGGRGSVQTLTRQGFAETPLEPGAVVWFTPGTIHRLINQDALRMVVIMQNSGLPEAGDAVFTFPRAVLADPAAYHRAAAQEPRARRDLAIEGFHALRHDTAALDDFYRAAVRLKAALFDEWEERWRTGALASAVSTGAHLTALRSGDWSHLNRAEVRRQDAVPRLGMCGHLATYDL
jgi:mannose-6-phosphate isomerase-like protein (cupin superfamily)